MIDLIPSCLAGSAEAALRVERSARVGPEQDRRTATPSHGEGGVNRGGGGGAGETSRGVDQVRELELLVITLLIVTNNFTNCYLLLLIVT